MKKVLLLFSIFMVSSTFLFAQQAPVKTLDKDVIDGKRPPTADEAKLMKAEENNNPEIAQAAHEVAVAMNTLKKINNDYGGNKTKALNELTETYILLRETVNQHLLPAKK
jgi:hypothetical protein